MLHSLHMRSRRSSEFMRMFIQEMLRAAYLIFVLFFLAALYAGFQFLWNRSLP